MKRLFTLALIILQVSLSNAQDASKAPRFNINIGLSKYDHWLNVTDKPNLVSNMGLSYNFSDFIEVGMFCGFSYINMYETDNSGEKIWDYPAMILGVQTSYHFSNHFSKIMNSNWDLYLQGNYGRYKGFFTDAYQAYLSSRSIDLPYSYLDYGLYIGANYMFLEHFGTYLHVGYGKFCNLKFGLNFKF